MPIDIVELNVGGTLITTSRKTLCRYPGTKLSNWFAKADESILPRDAQNRYFIDRDGELFRHLLNALRSESGTELSLPENYADLPRLKAEAEYYGLLEALDGVRMRSIAVSLPRYKSDTDGHITIGYHGTFSFGRQGMANDINFRKITRILVSGKVSLCREVFGDSLNENRDPDRGAEEDRYTARFFLKHTFLELAFDSLAAAGFRLVTSCGTGTNGPSMETKGVSQATEEDRWQHYNEFVFARP